MNPAALYKSKTLKSDLFTGIVLLLFSGVFFSVLVVADHLHDPTRTGKIFFIARWMLLVIPVGLIVFIRNWKQPADTLFLFVLLWAAWILLRGKTGGIWHDEKFFWFAGCLVFFFLTASMLMEVVRKSPMDEYVNNSPGSIDAKGKKCYVVTERRRTVGGSTTWSQSTTNETQTSITVSFTGLEGQ